MFEFLSADQNAPFAVALMVMFAIAIMEGLLVVLGVGLSNMIESMLPEIDIDFDADLSGPEFQSASVFTRLLGWLRIGKVPVLMLLVVFLTAFGLIGIAMQSFLHSSAGFMLPGIIASVPAFLLAMPVVRVTGGVIARVMPRDETDAISVDTLVGRIATITIGTARSGSPAEARVRDTHGTMHYIMVEPDDPASEFGRGDEVILLERVGSIFKVMNNTNASLVDDED